MLRQSRSRSTGRNPELCEQARPSDEGNLAWGVRAAQDMTGDEASHWTYLALLGSADTLSFRLRVAQSHLRRDMLPSYWSETILIALQGPSLDGANAIHVPLRQPDGFAFAPYENGVVSRQLADFDDTTRYPNIALIALPIAQEKILQRVEDFKRARYTLDALEHALRWLAFAWGVAKTGNPLHDNYGLPSACMLEIVCAAEGLDLTPGLESRASCPEAIWSAAAHWHEYFEKTGRQAPRGRYCHPHSYPISGDQPEKPSQPAPKRKTRR